MERRHYSSIDILLLVAKNPNFIYLTTLNKWELMLTEILELEKKFNALLPVPKQEGATPKALTDAGSAWSAAIWNEAKKLGKLSFTEKQINDALLLTERAVFICGSERSGTTLVRNLLDAHPQLSVLPSEGTYITNQEKQLLALAASERAEFLCKEWLWRLVISMHVQPYWLMGSSSLKHSAYIDFARVFITWWDIVEERLANKNSQWPFLILQLAFATSQNKIDEFDKIYWVEKTPNNEQHLDRLLKDFPNAKIIQTIRNPIDVFRSNKPHEKVSTVSKYAFIKNLQTSFQIANQQLAKKSIKHFIVRYEELCENPSLVTQQVATFLQIEYLPILLTPTVVGQLADPNSSFNQEGITGKIMKPKERKQEGKLTKKDRELLSASLRKLAEPIGYNLQPIGILQKQFLKAETFVTRAFNKIKKN